MQRLPKGVIDTPSAREIAQSGNAEEAFLTGKRIGEAMRELGLNYDLAPVVDVESVCGNPAIGSRSFGTDAATVARFGAEMARGIQAAGVMACAKHFPGHGGTNVDTHKSLPTITLSMEELEAGPLVPFYAAIEAGVKSIMTTHIMFPALDKEYPGTLSGAVLSALLRGKMRYGGIIITDCLEMGAIASRYGAAEAALLAAKAGADMPLISHSYNEAARAAELISRAIERGEMNMPEHNAALGRIAGAKEWLSMQ